MDKLEELIKGLEKEIHELTQNTEMIIERYLTLKKTYDGLLNEFDEYKETKEKEISNLQNQLEECKQKLQHTATITQDEKEMD